MSGNLNLREVRMGDSILIQRRVAELSRLNDMLRSDIARAQAHIAEHEAELGRLRIAEEVLKGLNSARREGPQPSIPEPAKATERTGEGDQRRVTLGNLIENVLREEDRPMKPVEIDRRIRARTTRLLHEKVVGKECCRLRDLGRLMQDPFTKEYSLPPDWGDDLPLKEESPPQANHRRARRAVPGGVH